MGRERSSKSLALGLFPALVELQETGDSLHAARESEVRDLGDERDEGLELAGKLAEDVRSRVFPGSA